MSVTNVSGGSQDSKKYVDSILTNIVYQIRVPCIMTINGIDHDAELSFQGLQIGDEYLPLHGFVSWWTEDKNEWTTIPANSNKRFIVQIKELGKYAMLVPAWNWSMDISYGSQWAGDSVRVERLRVGAASYPNAAVSCEFIVYNTGTRPIILEYGMDLYF